MDAKHNSSQEKSNENGEISDVNKKFIELSEENEAIVKGPKYKCIPKYLIGDALAILCACLFSLVPIFTKLAFTLNAAEHMAFRYTLQLIVTFIICKCGNVKVFGEKEQRKLLVARGIFGSLIVLFSATACQLIQPSDYVTIANANSIVTAIFCRIFIKEKLTIIHVFSLILTVFGVIAIFRPSFLFTKISIQTYFNSSTTYSNSTSFISQPSMTTNKIIGLTMSVLTALLLGLVQLVIKKLSMLKAHYATVNFYPSIIGVPMSLILTVIATLTGYSHKNFEFEKQYYLLHVAYGVAGAVAGVLGVLIYIISFNYEDATKISILKTTDILFSILLQFIIFGIRIDTLGIIGAVCILTGTVLTISLKLLESKMKKNRILKYAFSKF